MIKKDGITITDFNMDETGRFPVDKEKYYEQQLKQQHALQMLLIAVGCLSKCCEESDEFNDDLSKMGWFDMSLDEMERDILYALHPES